MLLYYLTLFFFLNITLNPKICSFRNMKEILKTLRKFSKNIWKLSLKTKKKFYKPALLPLAKNMMAKLNI